jgi:RNA polymerase sigma-70 factor (ECF subfamily)
MLSNRETAEEVTQDAFMSVWRQATTYNRGVGKVRPWLLSIVHHRAIDRMRRVRERVPNASLDEAWMKPATSDTFGEVYQGLQREQLRAALQRLPKEQRLTIDLAYFNGNTLVEIAEMMNVPVGTVKSRVRLGLEKMRSLLDEELAR